MEGVKSHDNLELLTTVKCILLFSGKRKSGKDHVTNIVHERIGRVESTIIKISGPIKTHWAKTLNLNVDELFGDGEYKEKYRLAMTKWGEDMRKADYGYFCRAAIDMFNARNKPIWIVSDIRRKTDIQWFIENFGSKCKTVRITCTDGVRQKRGWIFTAGIDDAETECDLDDVDNWDLQIINNNENIEDTIEQILALTK